MGFLYSQLFVTPPNPTTPLNGQTHIVTGSNTGLGFAAATHIASLKPAKLILAVRNLTSGATARDKIISTTGIDPSDIEVWQVDMSSFASVLSFTDRCAKDLDRLDGVCLNAGIQTSKFELMEGYESTLTVNVLSTFLLFLALLPVLKSSAKKHSITPRINIVSSEVHLWAKFPEKATPADKSILSVMSEPQPISRMERYCSSKLHQMLIFKHIVPLLKQSGDGYDNVIMNIMNPGLCYSDLNRDDGWDAVFMRYVFLPLLARKQEVGGRTLVASVVAGKESDGMYMCDGIVAEQETSDYLRSQEGKDMGERLWKEVKGILEGARSGITAEVK